MKEELIRLLRLLRIAIVIRNARQIQFNFYQRLESNIRGHNLNDKTRQVSWKLQRRYSSFKSVHDVCQENTSIMRKRYEESVIRLNTIIDKIFELGNGYEKD